MIDRGEIRGVDIERSSGLKDREPRLDAIKCFRRQAVTLPELLDADKTTEVVSEFDNPFCKNRPDTREGIKIFKRCCIEVDGWK